MGTFSWIHALSLMTIFLFPGYLSTAMERHPSCGDNTQTECLSAEPLCTLRLRFKLASTVISGSDPLVHILDSINSRSSEGEIPDFCRSHRCLVPEYPDTIGFYSEIQYLHLNVYRDP
jgi:hypothetical protein